MKPAVQQAVRPILEKAKGKAGAAAPAADEEMEEAAPVPAKTAGAATTKAKTVAAKPASKASASP